MSAQLISIAICTYERPELLERTLRSVLAQEGIDRGDVEIVVVDNSDGGSARPVIDALNQTACPQIRYAQAHPANISVARNTAIAAARGAWIACLDDDLAVETGWLAAIRDAIQRYDFDAMFGAMTAEFMDPASYNELAARTFSRVSNAPAGSPLAALGRMPQQDFPLSTANCVIRRAALARLDSLFEPRFGESGGEDFHFFLRLELAGGSFGWLPAAACIEAVPVHRCAEEYLVRRQFAGGQTFAAAMVMTSRFPSLAALSIAAKARLQLMLYKIAIAAKGGSAAPNRLREAGIRGKMAWRALHPLYREEARQLARRSGLQNAALRET